METNQTTNWPPEIRFAYILKAAAHARDDILAGRPDAAIGRLEVIAILASQPGSFLDTNMPQVAQLALEPTES